MQVCYPLRVEVYCRRQFSLTHTPHPVLPQTSVRNGRYMATQEALDTRSVHHTRHPGLCRLFREPKWNAMALQLRTTVRQGSVIRVLNGAGCCGTELCA